ncbi:MAG: HD domain-containing protein [Clostridia bacterium]|nr:HD domain-containing protein [Clostridia bacterium]
MDRDLSDLLIETYGATINDIVNLNGDLKIDTFSHSLKLSSCMMEFVDYLRKLSVEDLTKKIKHKERDLFINYIKNLTLVQYDKLIVLCWWHDIGKIKIRKEILTKPGKLTEDEYKEMSKHAAHSANLLRELGFSDDIVASVFFHHPKNFSEKKIYSFLPAISLLEITDIYTALKEPRIYRDEMLSTQEALKILQSELEKGLGNPFYKLFIEFVNEKEKEHYDIFKRFENTTLQDIVDKSIHYVDKHKQVSAAPVVTIK